MVAPDAFGPSQKWWGILPAFDPDAGNVVAEPPGAGYGFWAGAPSAVYDPGSNLFYCYHRLRWPLGDKRGGVCRIVASSDPSASPAAWRTVWEATREQFGANSIERASLIRDPFSQEWRLYICSETAQPYDRNPATWRIDLLQAASVETLDPRRRRIVMDAAMYGFSHVKDPVALVVGGDMPDLQTSVLFELLRVAGDAPIDAVALADGDGFSPLPCVLRCAPAASSAWWRRTRSCSAARSR